MISTLETIKLKIGDRILVKIGSSSYRAKIIDDSDPAKLRVELRNGSVLWTGRRSVEAILEYVLVKASEWNDFCSVATERGIAFTYSEEGDGVHIHNHLDEAESILFSIQVLDGISVERQKCQPALGSEGQENS